MAGSMLPVREGERLMTLPVGSVISQYQPEALRAKRGSGT
jgi:hypothetical protein